MFIINSLRLVCLTKCLTFVPEMRALQGLNCRAMSTSVTNALSEQTVKIGWLRSNLHVKSRRKIASYEVIALVRTIRLREQPSPRP